MGYIAPIKKLTMWVMVITKTNVDKNSPLWIQFLVYMENVLRKIPPVKLKSKKKIISYNSITLNINEINHTNESTSRKYFSWLSVNTGVNLINMYL